MAKVTVTLVQVVHDGDNHEVHGDGAQWQLKDGDGGYEATVEALCKGGFEPVDKEIG